MAETMIPCSVKNEHSTRKNKKPLMEKRRRARINTCLTQLKSLVLQAIKKDSSQFSKLEKADILELTVKHLRALQRQQAAGVMSQDTQVVSKYRAGFNECAKEVVRYMGSVREVNEEVKERVVGHLANCLQVVNQITPMETLQQQQMKPLHVHIPPTQQAPLGGGIAATVAPSVIMHTAAVSQTYAPSPLRSSPQDSQTSSPVAITTPTPISALPAAATVSGTTVVSSTASPISGAFKLVPSGSGTVAVYVGTSNSVPRGAGEAVSVDAVPLYSVSLPHPPPPHHTHHPHPPTATPLTAFVASQPSQRVAPVRVDSRYEDLSPVKKGDYSPTPLVAQASLPVDLRQTVKGKIMEDCAPYHALSAGHCSPALADDKLWRPW